MKKPTVDIDDIHLILAAEDCPPQDFERIHSFAASDDSIIRKLSAHGPVLLRGGRGSGKSALMIEAHRRLQTSETVFCIYVSLRHLPLLRSDGAEYINHFGRILSKSIIDEFKDRNENFDFPVAVDEVDMQRGLSELSNKLGKRIVILFDDAAHIGREKPLEVFFDLFRTLSSNVVSCKASIYPGVTKFGIRFDVYNDATVLDLNRSDVSKNSSYFYSVLQARYPVLIKPSIYSDRLNPNTFSKLVARAVVGNMRAFVLACNKFSDMDKINVPSLNQSLIAMATDYYWPLMEEVAPKLGLYEPLIEPATEIFEQIVSSVTRSPQGEGRTLAQDRILVHRQVVSKYAKAFEILEYLGFLSKREASRGMKSGGRGPVYALNLCNLIETMPSGRLTIDGIDQWIEGVLDPAEFHVNSNLFASISLPDLLEGDELKILLQDITVLKKSNAYPYGLTDDKIERLRGAGLNTVEKLGDASDDALHKIFGIGEVTVKRIRDVVHQAIWM
jgi:hypothetical protein